LFRFGLSALALALALALSRSAQATVLATLDLATLSQQADRVLLGTVERLDSHFVPGSQQYIVTDVTLRCERGLLGVPAGSRFVVRHLGGVVGELGQRIHGEASYRLGEQLLLFASERQGSYFALGMAQGALHLYRDGNGVTRAARHLEGAQLVSPTASSSPDDRPLAELLAEVETQLAQRAARRAPIRGGSQ
jgi:hypothetical protein